MKPSHAIWFSICLLAPPGAWAEEKPTQPAPNRPDEPIAKLLSYQRAAEFLDTANVHWTQTRKCGTCHTNYPYLMARPLLEEPEGPAMIKVRGFFRDRAANWDTKKPRWDTEVVATASSLAIYDAQTTKKLHPVTRLALDRMWTLQRPDGSWNWLKCDWPPQEHDDYYGVLFAALGVGHAPDGYAQTPKAQEGLLKIKAFLQKNPPPSMHHRIVLLWASCQLPDLMPEEDRQATIKEIRRLQRLDGGWSLATLGDWKRQNGSSNEAETAPSDGYATGLCVYVLRQAGLPKDESTVRKGVQWLRQNQRESGRWFTRSLTTDNYHYISHAGTALAVMALKSCE
jgi:squalene-hopene/tetraprenyl-beta-curcumene cyclase